MPHLERFISILVFVILCRMMLIVNAQTDSVPIRLAEVTIQAKDNPAHRLIRAAYVNRDRNGAFFSNTFQYLTYQKFWITPTCISDSASRLNNQYLFLSESVSNIFYKKPDKETEKIIASKTSGINNPIFNMALRRIQFDNFYRSDFLPIFETKYVSPISKKAVNLYNFDIEDTLFDGKDTLFVINFSPKAKSVFESLKGKIMIHSENYAVTYIEATPFPPDINIQASITQEYRKEDNGTWFPYQFSISVPFPQMMPEIDSLNLLCLSTVSIKNIVIDSAISNRNFGLYDLEEQITSEKVGIELLDTYRDTPLTSKELLTYKVIDSVGRAAKLDKKMNMLPSLAVGRVPIGPIDLDWTSLVNYTLVEGWRFGLGLYTNHKLTRVVSAGGYFAYGLKDKVWKWGSQVDLQLYRPRNLMLKIKVFHDIIESGSTSLISRDEMGLLNGELYRHWIINKFDDSKHLSAKLQMRVNKSFTLSVTGCYAQNRTLFDYSFNPQRKSEAQMTNYQYENFYLRAGVRFSLKEYTFKTTDWTLYQASRYPTIQLQYERGIRGVFNSDFNYNKVNLRVYYKPRYKKLGHSEITINSGLIDVALPYSLLYVSPAGYEQLGFDGKEQFAAMRPNEFLSDAYVSLFLRHNFGKMTRSERFSPQIVLCQNIGFGWLRNEAIHEGVDFRTMEKGYFESGLVVENLISYRNILAMGLGIFYRYGVYSFSDEKNNFALKVSLTVPIIE